MPDRVGQQIGNYRLVQLLGKGSFAEVYLGQNPHVHSLRAAVKIPHDNLPDVHKGEFLLEAQTIALLKHPHINRILDFGIEGDTPYLVMDYASQGTLRNFYPKGTIVLLSTVVSYVKQISEALQYAHDRRVVHRDLKPENLLIGNGIQVSDFGIATVVAQRTVSMETGSYAGTVLYSAPEQISGKPRPSSDQYSLAIICYEWLTGERPFTGSLNEVLMKQLNSLPRPLREKNPNIPLEVEKVIMKALTKDPHERFGSVNAFAHAFEQACITPSHPYPVAAPDESQLPTLPAVQQGSGVKQVEQPVPGQSIAPELSLAPSSQKAVPTEAVTATNQASLPPTPLAAPPLIQPSTRTVGGTILSLLFYLWGIFWLSLGLAVGITTYTGTDPVVFVASFIVGIVILIFLLRFRKRLYLGTWRRLLLEIGLLLIGVLVIYGLHISEGGVIAIYGLIAAFVAYW